MENFHCSWREEKWLKHYSSCHKILLVGEGDFSFSLTLAHSFGSAANIFATSLDSYETLIRKYGRAASNLAWLRSRGATVLHGVDATKMKHQIELYNLKFDRIVFNFPHAGFKGKEDNPLMIKMHKDLLRGFFSNARWFLQHNGEIHVSHKTSAPYSDWKLEELARENSLFLLECVPFNITDYPFYQNKRGDGLASDSPFNLGDCSTFKFISLFPPPEISIHYPNNPISNTSECISPLASLKFSHDYSNHLISSTSESISLPPSEFSDDYSNNPTSSTSKYGSLLSSKFSKDYSNYSYSSISKLISLLPSSKFDKDFSNNSISNAYKFIPSSIFDKDYSNNSISNTYKSNPLPPSIFVGDYSNNPISRGGISSNQNVQIELNRLHRDPFTQNHINPHMNPLPAVKFIVKGSVRLYPMASAYAGALLNSEDTLLATISGPLFDYDSNIVELLAIRQALLMFERSNLCGKAHLVVESGSNNAVSWIMSNIGNPWEVQPIVKEITMCMDRIRNVDVCCGYKELGIQTHHNVVDSLVEFAYEKETGLEHWY